VSERSQLSFANQEKQPPYPKFLFGLLIGLAVAVNATRMARLSNRRIHLTITRTVGQHDFVWVRVAWFAEWGPNQPLSGMKHFDPFPLIFCGFVGGDLSLDIYSDQREPMKPASVIGVTG